MCFSFFVSQISSLPPLFKGLSSAAEGCVPMREPGGQKSWVDRGWTCWTGRWTSWRGWTSSPWWSRGWGRAGSSRGRRRGTDAELNLNGVITITITITITTKTWCIRVEGSSEVVHAQALGQFRVHQGQTRHLFHPFINSILIAGLGGGCTHYRVDLSAVAIATLPNFSSLPPIRFSCTTDQLHLLLTRN